MKHLIHGKPQLKTILFWEDLLFWHFSCLFGTWVFSPSWRAGQCTSNHLWSYKRRHQTPAPQAMAVATQKCCWGWGFGTHPTWKQQTIHRHWCKLRDRFKAHMWDSQFEVCQRSGYMLGCALESNVDIAIKDIRRAGYCSDDKSTWPAVTQHRGQITLPVEQHVVASQSLPFITSIPK